MTPKLQRLHDALRSALGGAIAKLTERLGELTLEVKAPDHRAVAQLLRDHPQLKFEQLIDLCGVDYSAYGDGGWDGPRFAVVAHLLSVGHNWRVRLRTFCPDGEFPVLDSLIEVWPSVNWFEREAFDLFGIVFTGHPDLRRLLTDYGFIGHPFRKDFPVSGNVEMRYDPDQQRVIYQPVTIEPREITPRIVREENYADNEGFRKG
ncbi:MAG: NADH-quinone oxidoreductase subunit C [Betaproteobacteria bacterium RIFCSPLOWO2_12_FULL_62_13]|nr:MAG: NADH-quinone oxidoreductase subunit C [Betaproteobacteria bacterium RIFCSPLOWO2_12_FULL_62_13]